jgi:XapX domain-containing protein
MMDRSDEDVLAVAPPEGLLVGAICSLLNIRSPTPPLVALVGVLGILAGEQIVPVTKQLFAGAPMPVAWHTAKSAAHVFGELPGRHAKSKVVNATAQPPEPLS